jgi:hypothetical protein
MQDVLSMSHISTLQSLQAVLALAGPQTFAGPSNCGSKQVTHLTSIRHSKLGHVSRERSS